MVYAKATAIGIITGLLAVTLVFAVIFLIEFGYAATHSGGIRSVLNMRVFDVRLFDVQLSSFGLIESFTILIILVGFVAGFSWSVSRSKLPRARRGV